MKKLLAFAYYMPPLSNVGALRPTKFFKYLPENGWQPIVFSVDARYYGSDPDSPVPPEVRDLEMYRFPFKTYLSSGLVRLIVFPLVIIAMAWKKRKEVDAVYMTGEPFHPFALTFFTNFLFGLPTLLDFRDSWSTSNFLNKSIPTRRATLLRWIRQNVGRLIETIGIGFASAATFATPTLEREYAAAFPKFRSKFSTIYNGFDPQDFENIRPTRLTDKKTLVMAGKFHYYTPELAQILLASLKDFNDLVFVYIGSEQEIFADLAEKLGVRSQVITRGFLPYDEMLSIVAGCDFGLVTNAFVNGLGTKIFDYLALEKSALCFVPQGSIFFDVFNGDPRLIMSAEPHTGENVRKAIGKLLNTAPEHNLPKPVEFSRADSTRALANILNKISDHA